MEDEHTLGGNGQMLRPQIVRDNGLLCGNALGKRGLLFDGSGSDGAANTPDRRPYPFIVSGERMARQLVPAG